MYRYLTKKFKPFEIGFYLTRLADIGTTDHDLFCRFVPSAAAFAEAFPDADYISDDWFLYVAKKSEDPFLFRDGDGSRFINLNSVNMGMPAYPSFISHGGVSAIDKHIINIYGKREVNNDVVDLIESLDPYSTISGLSNPAYVLNLFLREIANTVFTANRERYKRLYEVYTAEYNPLWNVDGTETETHSGTDTNKHSGTDTTRNTGDDTTAHSGTDSTENSGTDTITGQVYPYDGAETNKEKTTTAYGRMQETVHGESVKTTYGRNTATEHGHKEEFEHGEKIIKERHGNIGVTKTTELIEDQINLWNNLSFLNDIAYDLIQEVSY